VSGRVLVVEDDAVLAMAIRDRLGSEGYTVECADDGATAFEAAAGSGWDLVILDLMLPVMDGLSVCRDLRARGVETPILILTARGETTDKVVGLKMGADDYLTKPFEMAELLARVEALQRRRGRIVYSEDSYTIGAFRLNIRSGVLDHGGETVSLTTFEFKLLKFLCEQRGEIVDRDTLLDAIWGYESDVYSRTVDVHIASVRRKLGDSQKQEHIITVRGQGYKLVG
jgi:two-component system, OmpR family, alkaline phosphatase synthesis response regulator PhoP